MNKTIYIFSILIIMFGCKTSEEVKSETNKTNKRYAIGQGGGFTGDYKEFILNEDGKVYKYDFKYDREVYVKDLVKADLIYFMEKIQGLGLDGIELNQPGNMSYYIDVRIGKTSVNKIIWGAHNQYPPSNLVDFHKELFAKLSEIE